MSGNSGTAAQAGIGLRVSLVERRVVVRQGFAEGDQPPARPVSVEDAGGDQVPALGERDPLIGALGPREVEDRPDAHWPP